MEVLLGSKKYLRGIDKDFQFGIGLKNNRTLYQEEEIIKIVDELNQFNLERNSSYDYLLYGKIENIIDDKVNTLSYQLNQTNYTFIIGYIDRYMPLSEDMIDIKDVNLSGVTVTSNILQLSDVILTYNSDSFIINKIIGRVDNNDGTFLLLLDSMTGITTTTKIVPSVARYNRYFKELKSTDYLRYYNSGFSINRFEDVIYQYNTFKSINVEGLKDNFNSPITSLYFRIKPTYTTTNAFKNNLSLDITDDLLMDRVYYDLNQLNFTLIDEIVKTFKDSEGTAYFFKQFYDNPIRKKSSVVTSATVDTLFVIPDYGIKFNNGDILYKRILDIGEFEDNIGLDYPYINNMQYVYNDIKFFIRRVIPLPLPLYLNPGQQGNDVYDNSLINNNLINNRLC